MLDKERNMLFPDRSVNFSSASPVAPHLQNTDFTPSSYFIGMHSLEETSKNRKFMNLDDKNHPDVSTVLTGNNQYYDKNIFSMRRQAEFENINKGLFSNPRQPYFHQKESSFFHETFKKDVSNLQDIDHIGYARQLEPSGFRSEYNCDLLRTFLHAQEKQQRGVIIPRLPVVLEPSGHEVARLEKEKLKNDSYTSKDLENIYLRKQDENATEYNNRPLVERSLCVNDCLNSERLTKIGDGIPANMDEQNKPTNGRVSPAISEKIWDGLLKLNTSTTVPAVAFFKSGEKVQDINWPAHVEIKGKVRLPAFEKFIQELPRSRNRALMVISLCWKVGSCRSDLAGMREVAKGYTETEKVGFAQIAPGIDLYVCPRNDIIITILAKYGFFKGMAAVEEDQDSLIGCVVWRRSQSSTNYVSKDTVGKKTLIEEQPLNSTGTPIQGMNSPAMEARECEKKQVMPTETELKAALDLPASEASTVIALTDNTISMITENKSALSSSNLHYTSIFQGGAVQTISSSIPYSCPVVPAQQKTSERPSLNLLQENRKPADTIPLAQNSGKDEAVLVSNSWTQFALPSQIAPVVMPGNSLSSSVSQNLGNFGSGPAPGPRPLIPVNSSNFQFQPQLEQKNHSSVGSDSNCAGKNLDPSFQATQPALLELPPLPLELLRRLAQSNENIPKAIINGGMLQDEIHIMHQIVARGPQDVLETSAPSVPQIQQTCDGSNSDGKEKEKEDDDDLPEFDFNSECGEQEAPISRFPGCAQQTHFPNAPPQNEKLSFEAPWSAGDPTSMETSTKSFEALQHRPKPSTFPSNLLNSNEGLSLAKNFGRFISEKTPSTERYQLTCQPSCLKETKDMGNNPRHGFGLERKSLWDDDDDDMPEWCPPDLELPEQPPPSATKCASLLSGRPQPPPETAAPLSFHTSQSHDLHQRSRPGLLGPCPPSDAPAGGSVQTRPVDEFVRFSKPPLGSRRRDSFRPHADRFNRRQTPYAADGRRHRR
ncbi:hypothetical protein IEQ34_009097 [Dendrobium chrysotoxum]|uniref:Spen paralogue and orthologue SPOC C-terminal domain-containing protein n=1 Tax=Dendrobium chrysotoxum TaxID=161865 RepID=A0AAV7H169_DENCH|nr:hypothetical protein IEQ34_009097 [Dendrobium chrysotoxum]